MWLHFGRVQLAPPWKKEEHTVNFHSVGRWYTVTDGECPLSWLNTRRPESLKGHHGVKHFRGSAYITPQIAAVDGFFVASFCSSFPTWDLPFCPFRHCPDECCGLIFFFFFLWEEIQKKIISTRNELAFVPQWSFQASVFVVLAEGTGMCGPWPGTLDMIVADGNFKRQFPELSS